MNDKSNGWIKMLTALDFAAVFLIGALFVIDGFFSETSPEQFKMLLGAIGLTATLSALCLRVAGVTKDEKRKAGYLQAGLRLARSVILFMFATLMRYVYSEAGAFGLNESVTLVLRVLTGVPSLFGFMMGLYLAVTGVSRAHDLLAAPESAGG
ncbi:MAG: hypothetical protein GX548_08580 [Lentisphaerae bacterium]|nr:hypothetical protein [Lentisphaerota bacterium]